MGGCFLRGVKRDDRISCWSREKPHVVLIPPFLLCLLGCRCVAENGRPFLADEEARRADQGCVFN